MDYKKLSKVLVAVGLIFFIGATFWYTFVLRMDYPFMIPAVSGGLIIVGQLVAKKEQGVEKDRVEKELERQRQMKKEREEKGNIENRG